MKPRTVLMPIVVPKLSDAAAVQMLQLLRDLIDIVEHLYQPQIHRHQVRRNRRPRSYGQPPPLTKDLF